MNKKQKKNFGIFAILLAVAILIFVNIKPFSILGTDYQYEKELTNGVVKSSREINQQTHLVRYEGSDSQADINNDITITKNSLDIRIKVDEYCDNCGTIQVPSEISTIAYTNFINSNIREIDEISFNYNIHSTFNGEYFRLDDKHDVVNKIALSSSKRDIILVENIHDLNSRLTSSVSGTKRITNAELLEMIPASVGDDEIFEILIYSDSPEGFVRGSEAIIENEIRITNLNVKISEITDEDDEEQEPDEVESEKIFYLFENNKCTEVEILPSLKTENHFENIEDCELNIIKPELPQLENKFNFVIIGIVLAIIIGFIFILKRR